MGKVLKSLSAIVALGLLPASALAEEGQANTERSTATASAAQEVNLARTTPVTVADRALAREIVLSLNPSEFSRKFLSEFFAIPPEQFIANAPQLRTLENQYPGLVALLLKRLQGWLNSNFEAIFEGGLEPQIEALAQNMSSQHLLETRDFFNTPSGQAFIAISLGSVALDTDGVSQEVGAASRGKKIDIEKMAPVNTGKVLSELFDLPDDQQDEIMDFLVSPAGINFLDASDKAEAARLKFVDEFMATRNDEIEAITLQVFTDYQNGAR